MREHYLFQDLLPAQVDPDAFATTKALFAALTKPARDLGRDRWSVLIGPEDWGPGAPPVTPPSFTDTRDRFGLLVAARGQQVFVGEALPDAPARRAGLRRTGGKPVVISVLLPNPGETFSLILALSRHLNRDGLTDWFGGLPRPGFPGLSCAVAEDFSHPRGDPEEACTKAALTWLRTGHRPGGPIP